MIRSDGILRLAAARSGRWIVIGVALLICINCATILKGDTEGLALSTPEPTPQAADYYVVVRRADTGAVVAEGPAPLRVQLKTGAGYFSRARYTVTAEDPEGVLPVREHSIETRWNWPLHVFSNLALGGLLGWFVVDPYTGAMWEFETESGLVEIAPPSFE